MRATTTLDGSRVTGTPGSLRDRTMAERKAAVTRCRRYRAAVPRRSSPARLRGMSLSADHHAARLPTGCGGPQGSGPGGGGGQLPGHRRGWPRARRARSCSGAGGCSRTSGGCHGDLLRNDLRWSLAAACRARNFKAYSGRFAATVMVGSVVRGPLVVGWSAMWSRSWSGVSSVGSSNSSRGDGAGVQVGDDDPGQSGPGAATSGPPRTDRVGTDTPQLNAPCCRYGQV